MRKEIVPSIAGIGIDDAFDICEPACAKQDSEAEGSPTKRGRVEWNGWTDPVKAALKVSVRYMARDLERKSIRVNAISTGAVTARAAPVKKHFDALLNETVSRTHLRKMVGACKIGRIALLLASDDRGSITSEALRAGVGFDVEGMVFS